MVMCKCGNGLVDIDALSGQQKTIEGALKIVYTCVFQVLETAGILANSWDELGGGRGGGGIAVCGLPLLGHDKVVDLDVVLFGGDRVDELFAECHGKRLESAGGYFALS